MSTLIIDNENNLLVFEYTRKMDEINNMFNVVAYNKNGEILARTKFISEEYNLSFQDWRIIFYNGYLYAVCEKKDCEGIPLRLMRFRLEGAD